jgi:hypothetical protein
LCAEVQSMVSAVLFSTTMVARLGDRNHNCQVET